MRILTEGASTTRFAPSIMTPSVRIACFAPSIMTPSVRIACFVPSIMTLSVRIARFLQPPALSPYGWANQLSNPICDCFYYAEQGELIIVFMDRPVRKSPRLRGYDYSLCGAYFLTICTNKFQHLFGKIYFALQENSIDLSDIGATVQKNLDALPKRFPDFEILNYVIMPNHLHILVLKVDLGTSKNRTISDFVCALKSLTTREIRLNYPSKQIWKESFHDHIIRNDRDLAIHWDYIEQNVNRWQKDKYFNSQIDH